MFYVIHITPVVQFSGFEPYFHQPYLIAVSVSDSLNSGATFGR
jgi:hypothetical protein